MSIRRTLLGLLLLFSALYAAAFLFVVQSRVLNPLDISPFESASVQVAHRFAQGLPMYADPSADFVPMLYGPMLFMLAYPWIKVMGVKILAVRIPSLIAVFLLPFVYHGIMRCLAISGQKPRPSYFLQAALATGMFLGFSGALVVGLDVAKVDTLFVFFMLCLLWATLSELNQHSIWKVLGVALAGVSAALSKSSGLVLLVIPPLLLLIQGRIRHALFTALAIVACAGGAFALLEGQEGSRFFLYSFILPATHPLKTPGIGMEFLQTSWPILILILVSAAVWGWDKRKEVMTIPGLLAVVRSQAGILTVAAFLSGACVVSWVGRLKLGSGGNSWLYFYSFASVFAAFVVVRVFDKGKDVGWPGMAIVGPTLLILSQFVVNRYNPIEERNAAIAGRQLAAQYAEHLCKLDGPVLMPISPYIPTVLCGWKGGFLSQAVQDIMTLPWLVQLFEKSLAASLAGKAFPTIIMHRLYTDEHIENALRAAAIMKKMGGSKPGDGGYSAFEGAVRMQRDIFSVYRIVPDAELSPAERRILDLEEIRSGARALLLKPR